MQASACWTFTARPGTGAPPGATGNGLPNECRETPDWRCVWSMLSVHDIRAHMLTVRIIGVLLLDIAVRRMHVG